MKICSLAGVFMVIVGFIFCAFVYISSPKTFVLDEMYTSSESDMMTEHEIKDMQADAPYLNKTYRNAGDFMRIQATIQKKRKHILERGCQLLDRRFTHLNMATDPPRNMIVDDNNQLMYCFVPKIACTSWKMVFLQLIGFVSPENTLQQYYINRYGLKKLHLLKEYNVLQRRYILGHYKKFLFTRNPYTRVLSVYRNKLEPKSTFERAQMWQNTLGKVITTRYQDKSSSSSDANNSLTFHKFLRYLFDGSSPDNKHWKSVYDSCFPCDVKYDIIGKFETLQTDAAYILKLAGVKNMVTFPKAETSSPTNSSNPKVLKEYYSKVPRIDMKKLYEKYRLDFQLFGYKEMKEVEPS